MKYLSPKFFSAYLGVLLFGLVFCTFLLVLGESRIRSESKNIEQLVQSLFELETASLLVEKMLLSQQGYMIFGEQHFLHEYEDTKVRLSKVHTDLSLFRLEDTFQRGILGVVGQKINLLEAALENRASKRLTVNTADIVTANRKIDALKGEISETFEALILEGKSLLDTQNLSTEDKIRQNEQLMLVTAAIAILLIMSIAGNFILRSSFRRLITGEVSEEEEVLELAVEGSKDGIFDWDIQSGDVNYSDQFITMLGCEPDEFKGSFEDFTDRLHPEEKETVQNYIDLYINGRLSEYSNTFRMRHKSGRWIWIRARGSVMQDDNGEPARFVGTVTDISAEKDYELKLEMAIQKAEKANAAKSEFLAHMSHEIRTPLTAITGVAEILAQSSHELDEKKQKLVKVLHSSSISLKDLISDILDFSKIESGELELEETSFSLPSVFEHITSIMSVRTKEKNLEFVFDYADVKDLDFYGDSVRIRQILINLIGNAIKFTEEGHVHVKARTEDQGGFSALRIDVEDTGIGISDEQAEIIFERFKQADSTVSRKFGGTGLGLPISKKLASLMGGSIEVESEIGKGSKFSFILPIIAGIEELVEGTDQDETARKKRIEELKAHIEKEKKALLVEDYEGNITVLGHILEEMNVQFDIAKTGLEAVNLWKENHYGLILMDIQMPEMDGFTSTRLIRSIESEKGFSRTPIVGMTAHALVSDKEKCLEAGMDGYLPKPIVEIDLKATVLEYLGDFVRVEEESPEN
ncbi:hybrid sensor histidine kinase/response regulator [Sneathiella litorea]|uniref:histidine kinase n=1 Tax=Sneathiella litorea TaxID=2606216 RepID=A0A6L8W6F3_9PROT|nr:ATP-binding protein [Sneathiella litorea]MZR30052.1 response regulator [Sneathiella litorea]